ncbi:hypothetical protein [Deinococcus sp.]|uniref:hypothetical protein n=1 Tax=Deinococcus sp. TaxID=47478 RepID=UPI003C7A9305
MRNLTVISLLLASTQVTAQTQNTEPQGKPELDRSSVTASADKLVQTVQQAVRDSGGDLERQNAQFVLAFSTGHYKTDPLGAQAARELATQFVNKLAVTGDQVTARAWELGLWPYREDQAASVRIGTDTATDKTRAADLWPTTPAVGSIGGHDTERTATELSGQFPNTAGTVLILLTNSAASVGNTGGKLMGTNAPEYQALLQHWNRVSGTQDGATLDLPYVVKSPSGNVQGDMEAVVFAPKTFTAAALAAPTRSERLKQVSAAPAAPRPASSAVPLVLIGLLVLGGLGFLLSRVLRGGGGGRSTLRVGDQTFSLGDAPQGRPFCVIAGPGYVSDDGVPLVPVQGFPAERVVELTRKGKEVQVRGTSEAVRLVSIAGRVLSDNSATLRLQPENPDQPLEFAGEVRGSGGVPRTVQKTVPLSFTQGDS